MAQFRATTVAFLASFLGLVCAAAPARADGLVSQGQATRIFDAAALGGGSYLNDHTLVQDETGRWHLFGIFHHEPADPENEIEFIHAVSTESNPTLWQPGAFQVSATAPVALTVDRSIGETHLWAPHVICVGPRRDGARIVPLYAMVYQSGGVDRDHAQIRLAFSTDLDHWTRAGTAPLFEDICDARDPMLKRIGSQWVLYYTRCADTVAHLSGVAYRTSSDLLNWSAPQMALVLHDRPLVNSGYTESPFVFEQGSDYYLSVTSYPVDYHASFVFRSKDPFHFSDAPFGRVWAHAPEWLEWAGQLLMTSAGWGQGGLDVFKMTVGR